MAEKESVAYKRAIREGLGRAGFAGRLCDSAHQDNFVRFSWSTSIGAEDIYSCVVCGWLPRDTGREEGPALGRQLLPVNRARNDQGDTLVLFQWLSCGRSTICICVKV